MNRERIPHLLIETARKLLESFIVKEGWNRIVLIKKQDEE